MASPHLLLFEPYHTGHHGQYVRVLVEHWAAHGLPGQLDVAVSREFAERYPALVATDAFGSSVAFHPTATPLALREKTSRRAVWQNDLQIGRMLRGAVERLRPHHAVALYGDHVQFSLATGLRFPFPVRLSWIYFRSSFYYREAGTGPATLRARLDDLQRRVLLRAALANPHADTVFSLDPYAAEPIRRLAPHARVIPLPEAVEPDAFRSGDEALRAESVRAVRERLGVEPGREVFLLFGSLDPRKGVVPLLEALSRLPNADAQRVCLVMAGESTGGIHGALAEALAAVRSAGAAQIVHLDAFVPDAEMHRLFEAASVVLMPYQRHVGSSGVLVRAAAAGRPVLAQDYGMIGAIVRDHRLGLAVDTTRVDSIAAALRCAVDPSRGVPFDPAAAAAFAAANTNAAMATTLFSGLGVCPSARHP